MLFRRWQWAGWRMATATNRPWFQPPVRLLSLVRLPARPVRTDKAADLFARFRVQRVRQSGAHAAGVDFDGCRSWSDGTRLPSRDRLPGACADRTGREGRERRADRW